MLPLHPFRIVPFPPTERKRTTLNYFHIFPLNVNARKHRKYIHFCRKANTLSYKSHDCTNCMQNFQGCTEILLRFIHFANISQSKSSCKTLTIVEEDRNCIRCSTSCDSTSAVETIISPCFKTFLKSGVIHPALKSRKHFNYQIAQ